MTGVIQSAQNASREQLSGGGPLSDEDLSQDQWVGRFALRLAMLDDTRQHSIELLIHLGSQLWLTYRGVEPEVIADAEYRAGLRR